MIHSSKPASCLDQEVQVSWSGLLDASSISARPHLERLGLLAISGVEKTSVRQHRGNVWFAQAYAEIFGVNAVGWREILDLRGFENLGGLGEQETSSHEWGDLTSELNSPG